LSCCIPKIHCYPIIYYAFQTQWVTFLAYLYLEITYYPLTFYCFTMKKDALRSFQVFVFTGQKTYRNIADDVNLNNLFLKHKNEIHVWNIHLYKNTHTWYIYIQVSNYSLLAKWFSHGDLSSLRPSAICFEQKIKLYLTVVFWRIPSLVRQICTSICFKRYIALLYLHL